MLNEITNLWRFFSREALAQSLGWGRSPREQKMKKSYKYRIIQKTLKSTRLYKYMDLSYYIKCYKAQFWTIIYLVIVALIFNKLHMFFDHYFQD